MEVIGTQGDVRLAREFKDRLLLAGIAPVERDEYETVLEYADRLLEQLENAGATPCVA